MERTIIHSDMNNFYASVECMLDMSLRDKPIAVGGDVENRHGIILAKNYEAKKYGIQTGEALWQARQKCRNLIIVPPHYEQYLKYSKLAREIYHMAWMKFGWMFPAVADFTGTGFRSQTKSGSG